MIAKAVEISGGQTALASLIGGKTRQGHVYQWLNRLKPISAEVALRIEEVTGKQVTKESLRPDIFKPS